MKIHRRSKIFVAGHQGMVGSSVVKYLKKKKFGKLITIKKSKLNLLNQKKVYNFLKKKKPDVLIICAARVGGIKANYKNPANFIYENLTIQNNLIHGSFLSKVKKLIFLGSSCIYPKEAKQPIKEKLLLTGKLEPTNQPYAIAKIAGIEMCRSYNKQYNTSFCCLMPCNLYGPNDNYNLEDSHFLPAIIKKIYVAKINKKKKINFWGTGKVKRELMYVDDLADACYFFLKQKIKHELINIGSGYERSINYFIKYVAKKIGYTGSIFFDNKRYYDGHLRKIISSKIAKSYGWKHKINFNLGLKLTLEDFYKNKRKYLGM